MDDQKYWAPAYQGGIGVSANLASSMPPKPVLPEVGDKILLQFSPYGGVVACNLETAQSVSGEYVEVEVKAIRKAKIVIE